MDLKLEKANLVAEQISNDINEITPITLNDRVLFQNKFDKDKHTYGNSWTYITQGSYGIGPNKLGYKYFDGKNLSAVSFYPKLENPDEIVMYFKRPIGADILNNIIDIGNFVKEKYDIKIFVKKLFKEQYKYLLNNGFKDIKNYPWHSTAYSEDDTYPEIILDVNKTLDPKHNTKKIRKIIRNLNEFKKNDGEIFMAKVSDKKKLWRIANNFFEQDISSLSHNISNANDYFNIIFNSEFERHLLFYIEKNGNPTGFYDIELFSDKVHASSYAALMLREDVEYLNDFSVINRCMFLQDQNYKYLNLGGSETSGLNHFKNKFIIKKTNQMYWCVLL